jgi:hypothetical protein
MMNSGGNLMLGKKQAGWFSRLLGYFKREKVQSETVPGMPRGNEQKLVELPDQNAAQAVTNGARLCIDFGSMYTKIAVRRGWDDPTSLLEFEISQDKDKGQQMCFPSIVCKSSLPGSKKWFCGEEAMVLKPGKGLHFYDNLKEDLLDRKKPNQDIMDAAKKFFKWLSQHEEIRPFIKSPISLCVPDFNLKDVWRERLQKLLEEVGWNCSGDFLITEPHANAIGIFTEGRNRTFQLYNAWQYDKCKGEKRADLKNMCNPKFGGFIDAARNAALNKDSPKNYCALSIDIGAYTTDFGYLYWKDLPENLQPVNETASELLGIKLLDNELKKTFNKPELALVRALSLRDYETMKIKLLDGGKYQISDGAQVQTLGEAKHQESIKKCVHEFTLNILKETTDFLNNCPKMKINDVIITGGGTLIPQLKREIEDYFMRKDTPVRDPGDKSMLIGKLYRGSWAEQGAHNQLLGNKITKEEVDKAWKEQWDHNRLLVRGGSAVGGASIYFDSDAGNKPLF